MNDRSKKTRMLVEGGVAIAMAKILSMFIFFQMPQGGEVDAASLVPLLVFAIRWGAKPGMLVGAAFGVIAFFLGPKFSFHPISIFLDYILPGALMGIVGYFADGGLGKVIQGTVIAVILKFISHVVSGVLVFYMYAPLGQNLWVYSIIYNSYVFVAGILNIVVLAFMYKSVVKNLKKTN